MSKPRKGRSSAGGGDDGRRNNRTPDKHKIKPREVRNPNGRGGNPAKTPLTSIDEHHLLEAAKVVSRDQYGDVTGDLRLVQEDWYDALVKKDVPARVRLLDRLTRINAAERLRRDKDLGWALSRKAELTELFYQAEVSGRAPPDIVPHPDHVDVVDGGLITTGPIDRKGRRLWEELKAIIAVAAWLHQKAREQHRHNPTEENAADLKAMQAHRRRVMRNVPKGWNWREKIFCRDSQSQFVAITLWKLRSLPDV
jgi:hypothetical protein